MKDTLYKPIDSIKLKRILDEIKKTDVFINRHTLIAYDFSISANKYMV